MIAELLDSGYRGKTSARDLIFRLLQNLLGSTISIATNTAPVPRWCTFSFCLAAKVYYHKMGVQKKTRKFAQVCLCGFAADTERKLILLNL